MVEKTPTHLNRELGWFGATILGLASVIGVGIFISIGFAASLSGTAVLGALIIAGILSGCNSLNLAQLAANHPVSGGIYEYGYRYLNPWLGFTGGWIYLLGKIAVAATAALGCAGYLLNFWDVEQHSWILIAVAEGIVLVLTLVILGGMKRSRNLALVTVTITLSSLLFLIVGGVITLPRIGFEPLTFVEGTPLEQVKGFLESVALLFVAYNGAGRISMLGEEVKEPQRNIPRAILTTLSITLCFYVAVAVIGLGCLGAEALGIAATEKVASLEIIAERFEIYGGSTWVTIGAITATLSVLLSVILGLSRILLAMGRKGDVPSFMAQLYGESVVPTWAILFVSITISLLILTGEVSITWSLAAFGGLCRSVIASLSALQLSETERIYPRWMSGLTFAGGLFLIGWLEWKVVLVGLGLIGLGLVWYAVSARMRLPSTEQA